MLERVRSVALPVVLLAILGLSLADVQGRLAAAAAPSCAVGRPASARPGLLPPDAVGFVLTPLGRMPSTVPFAVCALLALAALVDRRLARRASTGALPLVLVATIPPLGILLRHSVELVSNGVALARLPWLFGMAWVAVALTATSGVDLAPHDWLKGAREDLPAAVRSPGRLLFAAFVLAAVACIGWLQIRTEAPSGGVSVAEFRRWFASQPRTPLPIAPEGERVLIVKFNDYQCPPCRRTFLEYERLLARYEARQPGVVRLVVKDYPLEPECNRAVRRALHPSACEAAMAVRLAAQAGQRDAMVGWLFEHQAQLAPDAIWTRLEELAGGAPSARAAALARAQVEDDVGLGERMGISGTPTFFINGVRTGGLPPELFEAAVDLEIERTVAPRAAAPDSGRRPES